MYKITFDTILTYCRQAPTSMFDYGIFKQGNADDIKGQLCVHMFVLNTHNNVVVFGFASGAIMIIRKNIRNSKHVLTSSREELRKTFLYTTIDSVQTHPPQSEHHKEFSQTVRTSKGDLPIHWENIYYSEVKMFNSPSVQIYLPQLGAPQSGHDILQLVTDSKAYYKSLEENRKIL
jgi:hypothetical protein